MNTLIYGERAKIGLIYPSPGWVMEPEFYAMSPSGVSTYTTRISLKETNAEELTQIGDCAIDAAKLLVEAPVDVVALGCTSGSFINGAQYDQELIEKLEKVIGGVPCTTTATAVVDALRALNVKKVAVATPYIDEVNIQGKRFPEDNGFEVTNLEGLGLLYDSQIDSQDLETVYQLAKRVDTSNADAVAIFCTGIRSVPILKALEEDLGKPVISAIQAIFWE